MRITARLVAAMLVAVFTLTTAPVAAGAAPRQADRKEIAVSPKLLADYVGTYDLAPGINAWVRLRGEQLTVQLTGQGPLPVFPESETRFFLRVVDAQLEFGRDEKGVVSHLVLYQGGQEVKAMRVTTAVPAYVERVAIAVPAAVLNLYAGTYQLQPGFDLQVTLEGGQLMAQATGQGKFPLSAESPTKFFFEAAGIVMTFVMEASGALSHMEFEQGGRPAVKALRR